MSVFEQIELGFKGETFVVQPDKVMRLIALVEDVISLQELTSQPKLSKLAEAYTVALNYAGASAQTEEVYASLFGDGGSEVVQNTITSLIMMMLPPSTYSAPESGKKKDTNKD